MTVAAEHVKACCASVYGSAAARYLLGERLHPGGAELTSRLIGALEAHGGETLADIACGPGASALQLARETGCEVIGIDLSPQNVADASRWAAEASLADRVSFTCGDAESLPLADASIDGALCECALCTFPDKAAAAAQLARALRPGARPAAAPAQAQQPPRPFRETCTARTRRGHRRCLRRRAAVTRHRRR